MSHLIVWLAICLIVSSIGVFRPSVPLVCALSLLAFLPEAGAQIVTGIPLAGAAGALSVHPATWLLLIALPLQFCTAPHRFFELSLRRGGSASLALGVFIVLATLSTIEGRGTSGFSQLLESMVGPIFMFILIRIVVNHSPNRWLAICNALQLYGLLVAAFAIAQYLSRADLLYGHYYQTYYRAAGLSLTHLSQTGYRSTAFFGHPLLVAMFLVAVLPLMRRPGFGGRTPGMIGTLGVIAGIAATGSRSGLIVGVAYVLLGGILTRNDKGARHRLSAFLATPVGVVLVLFATPIGATVITRLTTHDASNAVRQDAASVFLDSWTQFVTYGRGIGASFAVSAEGLGAAHSFENPAMMLAVDAGLVATLCFYYALFSLAGQSRDTWRRPEGLAFLLTLLVSFGFSSYGTKSVAGYVLWLFAATASTADHAMAGKVQPRAQATHSVRVHTGLGAYRSRSRPGRLTAS
jgi:hypothetical protein